MAEFKIIANEEEQTIQYLIVAEGKETEIDRNNPLRKYDYNSFFSDLTGAMDIIKKNYDKLKFIGTEEEYEKVKDVIDDYYEDEIKLAKMKKVKKEQAPVEEKSKEIVSVNEDEQIKKLLDEGKEYRSKRDLVESFLRFKHAADLGSDEGESFVGRSYLLGEGIDQNVGKGLEICNKHPDSSIALCALGMYYKSNDKDKAFEFFSKAVTKGSIEAEIELGNCYLWGIGTDQNEHKGLALLERNSDDYFANKYLFEYYGAIEDYENSFEILKKLQDLTKEGFSLFNYKMGEYYYYGYGCNIDIPKAINYLDKAIDEESCDSEEIYRPLAKSLLGWIFCIEPDEFIYSGTRKKFSIEERQKIGFEFISSAAEEVIDSDTYVRLAYCYCFEIGTDKKTPLVEKYCNKAIENDEDVSDAYFLLGRIQMSKIDKIKYYEKASNLGHILAKYDLAEIYYGDASNHHKIEDISRAIDLYREAADAGYADAMYRLGNLYYVGYEKIGSLGKKYIKKDEEEGKKLIISAANLKYADAIEFCDKKDWNYKD